MLLMVAFTAVAAERVDRVTRVIDGDTFRADINGWPDIIGKDMPIRIRGIDAPEIRGACPNERVLAQMAKQYLADHLADAKTIELSDIERGSFFRLVATVIVDGVDIGDSIRSAGLARRYRRGAPNPWCR